MFFFSCWKENMGLSKAKTVRNPVITKASQNLRTGHLSSVNCLGMMTDLERVNILKIGGRLFG
jgi:hypothetical protein